MGSLLLVFLAAAGVAAPQPDGTLVMGVIGNERSGSAVHGERAMVADPRTGAAHTRRLAGGTLCHGELLAVGDRVLYVGARRRRSVVQSLPLTLAGPPRTIGWDSIFTPSTVAGRVWLGRTRDGRKVMRLSLREVDLASGRVTARTSEVLPRWSGVQAAMDGGFLITHGRWLTLWEHGLDRPLRSVRDGWPVATSASRFAWCDRDCSRFRVWSHSGERRLDPPAGFQPSYGEGTFSPDGSQLALPVTRPSGARVAIVDLATRRWTLAPGRLRGYRTMAWSPSGHWLYFTGLDSRLLAWERESGRTVRLPVDAHGTVMSISVTE